MLMMPLFAPHVKELTTTEWLAIVLVIVFVIVINFALFSAVRRNGNPDARVLQRFLTAVRNPNKDQNETLGELRDRVKRISKTKDEE